MSSPIVKTLKSTVAAASAALFLQIGSAAAASPRGDFQQQVRRVLTGAPARPSIGHPDSGRPDPLDRHTDAQAFVQRLLLGVSISRPADADSVRRPQPKGALGATRSTNTDEDAQATVRQLLLGQHASMRGAL